MAEALAPTQAPLSDMMLAMDVVDTLRHRDQLVERELSGTARREQMIARLREIYSSQGIAVPDRILEEGVDALEQDRFVYKPRTGGFGFTLARLYIRRAQVAKQVGIGVAAVVVLFAAWFFLVHQPGERSARELAVTIPAELQQLATTVAAEAVDPAVDAAAAQTAQDGIAAAAANDGASARNAVSSLDATLAELRLTYEIRIVSSPNERSGVYRIPDDNGGARNYYLIVQAIGPDGATVQRPITSEEDNSTRTVSEWGVRVPEAVYNSVAADKQDDGIIEDNIVGTKERGHLDVEWQMTTLGGAITDW